VKSSINQLITPGIKSDNEVEQQGRQFEIDCIVLLTQLS